MNQFFYEARAREKLDELRREGVASQAYFRLPKPPRRPLRMTSRVMAFAAVLLAVAGLLGR